MSNNFVTCPNNSGVTFGKEGHYLFNCVMCVTAWSISEGKHKAMVIKLLRPYFLYYLFYLNLIAQVKLNSLIHAKKKRKHAKNMSKSLHA